MSVVRGYRPTHAVIQGLQDEVAQLRRLLSLQRVESAGLEKRKGDGEANAQQTTGEPIKTDVKGDAKADETLSEVKQEKPEPVRREPGGSVERSPSVRFTCELSLLISDPSEVLRGSMRIGKNRKAGMRLESFWVE